MTETVADGGTASSATSDPSPSQPVVASVTSPHGGEVSFTPADASSAEVPGAGLIYTLLDEAFVIHAPDASGSEPLELVFDIDAASLPAGTSLTQLTVFRDGEAVPVCTGPVGVAAPDPCVASVSSAGGVASVTVLSSRASTWAFGINEAACLAQPFDDVATDGVFCTDIAWLKAEGITVGNGHGKYLPDAAMTRRAMAAFVYRMNNPDTEPSACAEQPFDDVPADSTFCGAIAWLKAEGITVGDGQGSYLPDAAMTRGATAAFVHRMSQPTLAATG